MTVEKVRKVGLWICFSIMILTIAVYVAIPEEDLKRLLPDRPDTLLITFEEVTGLTGAERDGKYPDSSYRIRVGDDVYRVETDQGKLTRVDKEASVVYEVMDGGKK